MGLGFTKGQKLLPLVVAAVENHLRRCAIVADGDVVVVGLKGLDGVVEGTDALNAIAQQVVSGTLALDAVDETALACALQTHALPDPDLLIRTSGEQRLSNFLPWQLAYTELYFTDLLWPEFDRAAFYQALRWYQGRQRRFGGLGQRHA